MKSGQINRGQLIGVRTRLINWDLTPIKRLDPEVSGAADDAGGGHQLFEQGQ